MQPMLETGNYDKESFCLSHENLKCYKKYMERGLNKCLGN